MPDDRFGDLGRKPSAAERLAELDEKGPSEERPAGPPPSARTGHRYTWVVGVAFLIAIVVVAVNSLPNAGRGFQGPPVGERLPAFAAPTIRGSDKVANVKQSGDDDRAGNATPACDVREEDVLSVCPETLERPLVLVFIVPGPKECEEQVDILERARARESFRGVDFVAVVSGRSREKVAELVRRRGWRLPVAVDRDLAVFNLYRVGFCPTTVAADRDGVVRAARVKEVLSERELRQLVAEVTGEEP